MKLTRRELRDLIYECVEEYLESNIDYIGELVSEVMDARRRPRRSHSRTRTVERPVTRPTSPAPTRLRTTSPWDEIIDDTLRTTLRAQQVQEHEQPPIDFPFVGDDADVNEPGLSPASVLLDESADIGPAQRLKMMQRQQQHQPVQRPEPVISQPVVHQQPVRPTSTVDDTTHASNVQRSPDQITLPFADVNAQTAQSSDDALPNVPDDVSQLIDAERIGEVMRRAGA